MVVAAGNFFCSSVFCNFNIPKFLLKIAEKQYYI